MSMEIEDYESIYKKIEDNFKNKFFDFNFNKQNGNKKLDYYKVLNSYLSDKGYGYIANQLNMLMSKNRINEIDEIEITKLLMDCDLIKKYNQSMESSIDKEKIENKTIIEYDKKSHTSKTINIKYNTNIAFKIVNVVYSKVDIISHKIDQRKKEVDIYININMNKRVNFTEIISIYTPFGVDKLEFTVKCKEYINEEIEVENIEEYLKLCIDNPNKAKEIFYKKDFKTWLIEKQYKAQVINYEQAESLKRKSYDKFKLFCMLNEIYTEDEIEVYINKDIPKDIIVEDIKDTPSETVEETVDNKDENNHNSDTDKIENEAEKVEIKEKGMFSGFKKKLGSIFKRK